MANPEKLKELEAQLERLQAQQSLFAAEIAGLRREINLLKFGVTVEQEPEPVKKESEVLAPVAPEAEEETKEDPSSLEGYIGTNISAVLGIVVLILGVSLGIKYAIDHDFIGIRARVVLGYLLGIGLFAVSKWLRYKYQGFSNMLVGGSMAIMYLVTFGAFSFFELISQEVAFLLMVIFTIVTIYEAVLRNAVAIAHFALFAGYVSPFLLATEENNTTFLFAYYVVLNAGIMVLSWFKKWKSLHLFSLFFTWFVFGVWTVVGADHLRDVSKCLGFGSIFYIVFYLSFILYHLHNRNSATALSISLILINAFAAYGFGYYCLDSAAVYRGYLGLFSAIHALSHLVMCRFIYIQNNEDKGLLALTFGFFVTLLTIAVPVQFDGNWVTLIWAAEGAALWFSYEKSRNTKVLILAVFLFVFGAISHIYDLHVVFQEHSLHEPFTPFWSISFVTTLVFFVFICAGYLFHVAKEEDDPIAKWPVRILGVLGLCVLFLGLDQEISLYYLIQADELQEIGYYSNTYSVFKQYLFGAGFIFVLGMLAFAVKKWRDLQTLVVLTTFILVIPVALKGNWHLWKMTHHGVATYLLQGVHWEWWRAFEYKGHYSLNSLLWGSLLVAYFLVRRNFRTTLNLRIVEVFLAVYLLGFTVFELAFHAFWFQWAGVTRFALSLWCGLYASGLVALGIWKGKQHLRVLAIAILALVFVKLFTYDSAGMEALPRTILYISLGIILLVISYLYNRYKSVINGDSAKK